MSLSDYLDLRTTPWSLPGSRLYLREGEGGLCLHGAEFEERPVVTRLLRGIEVLDGEGRPLPITAVRAEVVEWGGGTVTATFAGRDAISIGARAGERLHLRASRAELPVQIAGQAVAEGDDRFDVVVRGDHVVIGFGDLPAGGHAEHQNATSVVWQQWLAACPVVRPDLAPMAQFCWWVLGANTVALRGFKPWGVVPSLTDYMGVWQWDAYFIARGLRHGAPDLARAQLDLVLGTMGSDGQLPDTVYDNGVLRSSDELTPADQANLRARGLPAADLQAVPLTKPPLAAWAALALAEYPGEHVDKQFDQAWLIWAMDIALTSQRWWFADSDADGDGMPEYGHPFSSGLDDSPIFDTLPVRTPDLAAYLVLQDELLAEFARSRGEDAVAQECGERAAATRLGLQEMWHGDRFLALGPQGPVSVDAITGLLPLLVPGLPEPEVDALVAALVDPTRYGTRYGLPTVAVGDPSFEATRMWRGPTWINTNLLVIEGLRTAGRHEAAHELTERTLATVIAAGGPFEFVDAVTATPAPRAASCFSWSAALFVDLAVQAS